MHKVAQDLPHPQLPAGTGEALGDLSQEEGNDSPSHTKQQVHKSASGGWTFSQGTLTLPVLIFSIKSEGDTG